MTNTSSPHCCASEHDMSDKQPVACFQKQQRDTYVSQLKPSTTAISRVKIKLLGSSGSGKTTLVNSLTSGYLSSLFKRSRGSSFRNTTRKKSKSAV